MNSVHNLEEKEWQVLWLSSFHLLIFFNIVAKINWQTPSPSSCSFILPQWVQMYHIHWKTTLRCVTHEKRNSDLKSQKLVGLIQLSEQLLRVAVHRKYRCPFTPTLN